MDELRCPACRAENEDDAAYCDQCGQHLIAAPADGGEGEGACPACGGAVESRGGGKGACAGCGLELTETAAEPPSAKGDAGTAERLTAAILRKTSSGLALERAVAEACADVLGAPAPEEAAKPAGAPVPCPLCGVENPDDAARCSSCGLWFTRLRSPQPCPRCERGVAGDGKCECGAILTLPKLLEYVERSVRWVCSRCKAPYAAARPKCPDCGAALLCAERLKAFAASLSGG